MSDFCKISYSDRNVSRPKQPKLKSPVTETARNGKTETKSPVTETARNGQTESARPESRLYPKFPACD